LGYAPAFFILRKGTAQNTLMSGATEYANAFFPLGLNKYFKDDAYTWFIHPYADTTKLYIEARNAKPSTTMNFRYYILVDLSQVFSGADGVAHRVTHGLKIAREGFNVQTAKEYQLAFSSEYKIAQYHAVNCKTETLTLPAMFASYHDQDVEEATYVDIVHGLGFAPLPIIHAYGSYTTSGILRETPITTIGPIDNWSGSISWFSDSTRVRIYFWRSSIYSVLGTESFPAETITLRAYLLAENLASEAYP